MAQKINVTLVDDLTGDPAHETVTFGLDGATYEIDLSNKNAKALRDALATYVGAARRVSGRRGGAAAGRRGGAAAGTDRRRTQEIREWARKKGLKINERGRIPADIIAQFEGSRR